MRASLTLFVSVVLLLTLVSAEHPCPKVFDGLTNGHFDLSSQFSTSEISGNWAGLDKEQVIGYEWAIVSEDKIKQHSTFHSVECRRTSGFLSLPDIQPWVDVKKETSATSSNLQLTPGTTYYIVVRTTLADGVHVYSNSNGIQILSPELQLEGSTQHSSHHDTEMTRVFSSHQTQIRSIESVEQVEEECIFDQTNQCNGVQISVREILAQLYGPPVFPGLQPVAGLADDDDDDDDDDGAGGAILAIIAGFLIAMLCLLLFCFLLALLAAIFYKREHNSHDDDHKFNESVHVTETDHVDADLGSTNEHTLADDTRVEFPDYDPKTRLSVAS